MAEVSIRAFKDSNNRLIIVLENPPKNVTEQLSKIINGAMADLSQVLAPEETDAKEIVKEIGEAPVTELKQDEPKEVKKPVETKPEEPEDDSDEKMPWE